MLETVKLAVGEMCIRDRVEVAGPGFINLFLAPSFWASVVLGACSNKEYGRTDHGKGAKYNVESVSYTHLDVYKRQA